MPGIYYQSSGRSPVGGVMLAAVLSIVAASVLAAVYAYASVYIPFIYIIFILTAGFGLGIGMAGALTLRLGKVRGKGASWLVFLLATTVGYYVGWTVWLYAQIKRGDGDIELSWLLPKPGEVWAGIKAANEGGVWSIKSWTPTGGVLWAFWAGEAAIIFGASLFTGIGHVGTDTFCEKCNLWCEESEGVAVFATDDTMGTEVLRRAALKQHAEQSDWAYFAGLGQPDIDTLFYRADVHACEQCKQTNTLTVKAVTVSHDKEGARSEATETVVDKLLISTQDVEKLSQFGAAEAEVPVLG